MWKICLETVIRAVSVPVDGVGFVGVVVVIGAGLGAAPSVQATSGQGMDCELAP